MEEQVFNYIQKHQMLPAGSRVLVALSGGCDSVCLLRFLKEYAEKWQILLSAVHIHHGIRGEEADRDAAFCEKLCEELEIPFFLYRFDVPGFAKKEHLSLEEAGRKVRYQAFELYATQWRADKIALAHHRSDMAETFLFHLARGSSITGLGSIRPVRGKLIRPLLCVERAQIADYVKKKGWDYLDDSTNDEELYTRNKLRLRVLPFFQREINAKSVEHIARAGEELQEIDDYLRAETEKLAAVCLKTEQGEVLLAQELSKAPALLGKRLILQAVELVSGSRRDFGSVHAEAVWALFEKPAGRQQNLPGALVAIRERAGVRIAKKTKAGAAVFFPKELLVGEQQLWGTYRIASREIFEKGERFPEKAYTKWIDYDRIEQKLTFRTRQTGDFICTCRDGGRKKLKDYMIDAGIPRQKRDEVLLLADGQEIVWVVGWRLSEKYKLSAETQRILEIKIQGGSTNE